MAVLNTIAKEIADEIRDGIAWVIVWKTGRSWNAEAVWLNIDDDTIELLTDGIAIKISNSADSGLLIAVFLKACLRIR